MKPVPMIESGDVTSQANNELREEQRQVVSEAQQKAQQLQFEESNDPALLRLLKAWEILDENEHNTLIAYAIQLRGTNNQRS
jgi:hypothetical protein